MKKTILYILLCLAAYSATGQINSISLVRDSITNMTLTQAGGKYILTITKYEKAVTDTLYTAPDSLTIDTIYTDTIYSQYRYITDTQYEMKNYLQKENQNFAQEDAAYAIRILRATEARDEAIEAIAILQSERQRLAAKKAEILLMLGL